MPATALATRPKSRTRPATSSPVARPRILVTGGDARQTKAVARSLKTLRADVDTTEWHAYAEALTKPVAAMVIVEPMPVRIAAAIAAVRGQPAGQDIALYAVIATESRSRQARTAYLAGATAVVEWPRERRILADILAETMGMSRVRGPSNLPDTALTRAVRAHLRVGPRPGSRVRLSSGRGVVAASGEARSMAELKEIVETIARVPGVKHVVTDGLHVAASDLPDRRIRSGVRAVIRATSELEPDALQVSVRGGRVRLTGEVPSRADFHRLLDAIAEVRGVRDLDWEITIAADRAEPDSKVARRLRRAIATLYPDEAIRLGVAGGVAELAGRTRHLVTKRAVERLVERDDGVSRVVNKLVVSR